MLSLLYKLCVLFGKRYRSKSNAYYCKTAKFSPFCGKCAVHCVFKVCIVRHYLIGTESKFGKLSECGLKRAYEFGLELPVKCVSCVFSLNVSANVRIEKKRIRYFVGINTRTANRNIDIKSYVRVNNSERNRIRCSEFVVYKFLCVEIVNPLILARISAVSKALAYRFERVDYSLAQRSGKYARLR